MGLPLGGTSHQQNPPEKRPAVRPGCEPAGSSDNQQCRRLRQKLGEVAPEVSQTTEYLEGVASDRAIEVGVLVNYLLIDAVKLAASDIHIEQWESTLVVRRSEEH